MPRFRIPCSWEMYGYMDIEADSLADAIVESYDKENPEGHYVDGSFYVDADVLAEENKISGQEASDAYDLACEKMRQD